jgi:hypothetical protein
MKKKKNIGNKNKYMYIINILEKKIKNFDVPSQQNSLFKTTNKKVLAVEEAKLDPDRFRFSIPFACDRKKTHAHLHASCYGTGYQQHHDQQQQQHQNSQQKQQLVLVGDRSVDCCC